ncbi:MAG: dihydropteroate synthase [Candidatus Omnitrophica bacterium]|nr:dihydropteroate synthase [Candidatus Omnitrophota bacterium]
MDEKDMLLKDHVLPIGKRTCIMGILNVTPDSFSDGGKYLNKDRAVAKALEMSEAGADIIDIGGESTRPGAEPVSAEEEIGRVLPVINALKGIVKTPMSIDTYKSSVAKKALEAGVELVNDITALTGDPEMGAVVAEYGASVVLMHMKGTPVTMQDGPKYRNVIEEVYDFLKSAVDRAVEAGIPANKIIVDPGIGFGKTLEHNLAIIKALARFKELDKPILIGLSRKSFIGSITGKGPDSREFGTAGASAVAVLNGADILRVHDIGQIKEVCLVVDAIKGR